MVQDSGTLIRTISFYNLVEDFELITPFRNKFNTLR